MKRNDAVNELILTKLRETDDFVVAVTPASRKATMLEQRIMTIVVSTGNIVVLVETNEKTSVGLLISAPNLNALSLWACQFKEAILPVKRPRTPSVKVNAHFVLSNVTRRTLSVKVVGDTGQKSRRVVTVSEWTQGLVDEAVEELTEHLRNHHHVQQDDEWLLAGEHRLGIFANQVWDEPSDSHSDSWDGSGDE